MRGWLTETVKTRAAVVWEEGSDWDVVEITLDDPHPGEVLIRTSYAGLCHSDEHLRLGDMSLPPDWGLPPFLPAIGGHEGSGVVEAVGDGVSSVEVGDHVAMSFIPACGRCPSCSTGHQNLCDLGAELFAADGMIADHTHRHHHGDRDLNPMCQLGTFAEMIVANEASVVKVEPHHDLRRVALVSCGVATGWGSVVNTGEARPGDAVVVVGVGGVGINAVQGARHAGAQTIVAVDPVESKRDAALRLGATHTAESIGDAAGPLAEATRGVNAQVVVLSPGTVTGDMIGPAMTLVAKGGRLVVTGLAHLLQSDAQLGLLDLALMEKQIRGSLFGSCNPRVDIPRLLRLADQGALELDELVSATYRLEEINRGYHDLRSGRIVRGLVEFG